MLKPLILDALKELLKENKADLVKSLREEVKSILTGKSVEPEDDEVFKPVQPEEFGKALKDLAEDESQGYTDDIAHVEPLEDDGEDISGPELSKLVQPTDRFLSLGNGLYYAKNIRATTFLNKADFKGGKTFPLPDNKSVHIDNVPKLIGCSLPVPINKNRLITLIHRETGTSICLQQIDVGPGYVDDMYWTKGTNPKTETGKGADGSKSAYAGIDLVPLVWEEMGLASFNQAFETGVNGFFDLLIFEPTAISKPVGLPSSTLPAWNLPSTGSEFFTWTGDVDMLSGWKEKSPPPAEYLQNLVKAIGVAHKARLKFGPIRVASGLRSPAHNLAIGGREGSMHTFGRSLDLHPENATYKALYEWLKMYYANDLAELYWEQHLEAPSREHVHISIKLKSSEKSDVRIIP